MKLVIFGNSGSGKSTLARALAARHALAHLDLDSIVWEPQRVAVARAPDAVRADLDAFVHAHARWAVEGCYGEWVVHAATQADELVFLNPGIEACLAHNRRRAWEPHEYRSRAAQDSTLACSTHCRRGWRATRRVTMRGRSARTARCWMRMPGARSNSTMRHWRVCRALGCT